MTNDTPDPDQERLFFRDIAALGGYTLASIGAIHRRAARNRRLADENQDPTMIRTGDLPSPDGYEKAKGRGRPQPYWYRPTINEWMERKRPYRR